MVHYIVLWQSPRFVRTDIAIESDVHATSPQAARKIFLELFPNDRVVAVKVYKGNGRFV